MHDEQRIIITKTVICNVTYELYMLISWIIINIAYLGQWQEFEDVLKCIFEVK